MKDTNPKAFVFVLMPFNGEFDDIYELGIKAACEEAGAYCERVDKQIFVENILERVYNQISKADIIVAEMTGRNPNVFYETGYAHALNKTVILLTQDAEDIPFDLKHYPHIVYGGKITLLKSQLQARVRWCIDNPQKPLTKVDLNLTLFIDGVELKGEPEIIIEKDIKLLPDGGLTKGLSISLGIHNPSKKIADPQHFNIALVMHNSVEITPEYKELRSDPNSLPNGGILYNLQVRDSIFPDGWHNFIVPLRRHATDEPRKCSVRLFTELGSIDHPFTLAVKESDEHAELGISEQIDDGVVILGLVGKTTIGDGSVKFRRAIRKHLAMGVKRIVLNWAGVSYMDSSGVGEIWASLKASMKQQCILVHVSPTKFVEDLLETVKMLKVLTIYPTVEDAVKAIKAQSFQDYIKTMGTNVKKPEASV
jgi:anti-anti-sigma factor